MAQHVDALKVTEVFLVWAKQALPVEAGQVVSFDGKALASTVQECHGNQQDFVSVVSACVQQWDGGLDSSASTMAKVAKLPVSDNCCNSSMLRECG